MQHSVYAFDAYGTLFDVHAAVRRYSDVLGPEAQQFSQIWRNKQLEYSWVHSLMGSYQNFWDLTELALDAAFHHCPSIDKSHRNALLEAYWHLDCYPEVPMVLKALKESGCRLVILSNGSPEMLSAACKAAEIEDLFDEVFSVDLIGRYKPDPQVYDMVTTHFRVYPNAVSFQSSNRWDIAGASNFGFRTVWLNRFQYPEEYHDYPASAVLADLTGLTSL
ncbi:haloacid dehalogenase type II [Polycladidibacter stylochi]|uniref:haloacid dehalogenase type II n=1 Tax=Polycladidibacter stylochi TaxID=1807766 RepID=UPI00082D6473|nr:haloacid dehalogenase type II [Pseudovibrio stylochi]